ncbi:MAG: type II toxin-antitoxin system RelE/ParE family toxin [bacterium]
MAWQVDFSGQFVPEFQALDEAVQDELLAHVKVLEEFGPHLGRPRVDTLAGSRHTNMKELRFDAAGGVWRFVFAFDPKRKAIILCGGDKSGGSQARFYKRLLAKADERFEAHLAALRRAEGSKGGSKNRKRGS